MPTLTRNALGSIAGGSRGTPVAPHNEPNTACDEFGVFANNSSDDYDNNSGTAVEVQINQSDLPFAHADETAGTFAKASHPPNFNEKSTSTLDNHSSTQLDVDDEMKDKTNGIRATSCPPDDCPICFEFFADPITLQCRHSFCRACLLECTLLAPNGQCCPLCRQSLADDNFLTTACNTKLQKQVEKIF